MQNILLCSLACEAAWASQALPSPAKVHTFIINQATTLSVSRGWLPKKPPGAVYGELQGHFHPGVELTAPPALSALQQAPL